ncbi:SMI1/KNR4 family protein [Hymenobacter ruber]
MNIHGIIAAIKAGPNDITLYPGAEQSLIDDFEKRMGFNLPADLKVFYQFCNGFESAEDLFRIVPTDEILERVDYDRAHYGTQSNQLYFAEYLIYCDSWKIEIDSHHPNSYRIYAGPNISGEPGIMLTNSLAEFLSKFLEGGVFNDGGLYKWQEEITE